MMMLLTIVSVALLVLRPSLKMPPPNWPELPLSVQLLTANLEWSLKIPPPPPAPPAPLVTVRLESVTVLDGRM